MNRTAFVALTCLLFVVPTSAGEPDLNIAPASNEGELALAGFSRPDGVEVSLVAAEPDLANPVAFTFDGQMNAYIAETYRQEKGVEDNRGHMGWLEDELSSQTVADREAMFRKHLDAETLERLQASPDRIRFLTGRTADGSYTESKVFHPGFSDLMTGTGAGLLARESENGTEVFYSCIPDLYRMSDAERDGVADSTESVSTGYGVRVAYRGHDMHGLIRGPDGKLYWSIGDRGFHVKTDDGRLLHKPDTGAVFRCNLDGSDLEVFAYGLRNPQELAFNDEGELFTVDNNSDSGDLARLVSVREGSDSGWRMHYQYLEDRGPWNREAMWAPHGDISAASEWTAGANADVQPTYVLPPVANITDGPGGFTCYPGTGWGEELQGRFFISDFRGTASKSGVRSFTVKRNGAKRDGAFFEIGPDDQFIWGALVTDVDFGYDGSLYITDWVDGWTGIGKGRLYKFTDQEHAEEATETARLFASGFRGRDSSELSDLLAHPDRRVRFEAQWLLAERGETSLLAFAVGNDLHPTARLHGVWGLGQIAAAGDEEAADALRQMLGRDDAFVRLNAARALGWTARPGEPTVASGEITSRLLELLQDRPDVAAEAAVSFGRLNRATPLDLPTAERFVDALAKNDDRDPALRQSLIYGLSLAGSLRDDADVRPRILLTAIADSSDAVRRAGAVVLRHWKSPLIRKLLEGSPAVRLEAARAIYDGEIDKAMPSLAGLEITSKTPDALARRVVAANFRLGDAAAAERLVTAAADASLSQSLREEALTLLSLWDEPPKLDRFDSKFRLLPGRPLDMARPALAARINGLLSDETVRPLALPLVGQYEFESAVPTLQRLARDAGLKPAVRVSAVESLRQLSSDGLAEFARELLSDRDGGVRSAARDVLSVLDPAFAVDSLREAIDRGGLREQQAAVKTLGTMASPAADTALADWLGRDAATVPVGFQLDLIRAAESRNEPELLELAATFGKLDGGSPTDEYRMCLEGGSAKNGQSIFFGRAAASCRRCHVVNGSGSAVGPELSEIGKEKDRRYLLEAIVEPNKAIAKGFATKNLLLADGRVVSGVVSAEDEDSVTLTRPSGEKIRVLKDDVDDEAEGLSGMPADLHKTLSREDIRDLVEYLTTLKVRKVSTDVGGHE